MLLSISLVLVTAVLAQTTQAQSCNFPPNIQYVSRAYNIMYGNPYVVGSFDEGFTKPIFDLSTCKNGQKWDSYDVPDGSNIVGVSTCDMIQQYNAMSGVHSYSDSLSTSASASFSAHDIVWKASFSASVDYQKVQTATTKKNQVSVSSFAKCGVYEVALSTPYSGPPLTQNFRTYIEKMPLSYSENPSYFFEFIDVDFGTHYLSEMFMGGRYGVRSEFESSSFSSFSSSNLDIKQAASFSTLFVGGSESSQTNSAKSQAQDYLQATYEYDSFYVGGELPSNGNATTWQRSLKSAPMPMYYKLEGVLGLLNSYYFPSISSSDLQKKYNALQEALNEYCEQVAQNVSANYNYKVYCNGAPADPGLPGTSIFGGLYTPGQYKNPYTQEYNCPAHFSSILISEYYTNKTTKHASYLCLNETQKSHDAMRYFGGMWFGLDGCIIKNPMTGTCGCGSGMTQSTTAIGLYSPDPQYEAQLLECYNKTGNLEGDPILGGFYVKKKSGSIDCNYPVTNPITNAESCPPNYTAYPVQDFCCAEDPNADCFAIGTQFVCLNNIYST